jgi:hypothetical protein
MKASNIALLLCCSSYFSFSFGNEAQFPADWISLVQLPFYRPFEGSDDDKMAESWLLGQARAMAQIQVADKIHNYQKIQDARAAGASEIATQDSMPSQKTAPHPIDERTAEVTSLLAQGSSTSAREKHNPPVQTPVMLTSAGSEAAKKKMLADRAAAAAAMDSAEADQDKADQEIVAKEQKYRQWAVQKNAQDKAETAAFMKDMLSAEQASYGNAESAYDTGKTTSEDGEDSPWMNPDNSVPKILANVGHRLNSIFGRHLSGLVKNGGAPDMSDMNANFISM